MANWATGNAHVKVKPGFTREEKEINVGKALSAFKKKVKDYGILLESKTRMEYEKPSVKKRRNKLQAIRQNQREVSMELD